MLEMEPAQARVWMEYTRDALRLLAGSLASYRQGSPESYRVAAVELRLLLCDTNRVHGRLVDISLVPRVFPGLRFHPLRASPEAGGDPLVRFDLDREPLPLPGWLAQPLAIPGNGANSLRELSLRELSLRELIRTICEQDGGAHVDPRFHSPLLRWPGRAPAIIDLGEYVMARIENSFPYS